MNLLYILIVFILKLQCEGDEVIIEKIYFIENNCWPVNQQQSKTDEGYLYRIAIFFQDKIGCRFGVNYSAISCPFLASTNLRYAIMKGRMSEYIISIKNSPGCCKFFLNFDFYFTNILIDNQNLLNYDETIRSYKTYKLLEKNSESDNNNIIFIKDSEEIRMCHIKNMLIEIINNKPLKLIERISVINERLKDDATFELYYFKNHSECYDGLLDFVNNLTHFNLVEDTDAELLNSRSSKISNEITTTLKVSEFLNRLRQKIKVNEEKPVYNITIGYKYRTLMSNFFKINDHIDNRPTENNLYKTSTPCQTFVSLIEKCFEHVKNEILNRNIFLLIGGKYDIDFYIDQLYDQIYKSVKLTQELYDLDNFENTEFILRDVNKLIGHKLKNLELTVVKSLCEYDYVNKHFSKLFGKNISTLDDYICVDKIMCDYHNMLVYIINSEQQISSSSCALLNYFAPIFIDNYDYRVVDGFEISIKGLAEIDQIKGFDDKKQESILQENIDYFVDKSTKTYYVVSEVLKSKKIHDIEILYYVYKFNKMLRMSKCLFV